MKKSLLLALVLMFAVLLPNHNSQASSLSNRLSGRILLQTESKGEAWYVNPSNEQRYYLGRPADAFQVMRELGLGISDSDLSSIVVASENQATSKILWQEEGQTLTYVNYDTFVNGAKSGFSKNKFFVNNKPLFNDAYIEGDNFKLYKINQKDTVELYYDLTEMGVNRYWYIINLSGLSYTLVNESENESGDIDLYINNDPTDSIVAVKKHFIGISTDLNKIYFSAESENSKINYSYNLTTHKIIKEEPTDKLETTLVKTF